MEKIFFNGWENIIRTVIVCILGYISIVVLLRISGKRTLSKMNAFDWIVTIALGSSFATSVLTKSVSLADGLTAFILLIFLQLAVSWIAVRSKSFSNIIKAQPSLLFYKGDFIEKALISERVTEEEIMAQIRKMGYSNIQEIDAVVMETDGSLSVIRSGNLNDLALNRIKKYGTDN